MAETHRLALPLLQPAQAQKHVTVNEALMRIDGLVNLVLLSRSVSTPPAAVQVGVAYDVPVGAVNAWAGQDGKVAIGANGGWVFVTPAAGWRAFVADRGVPAMHDGQAWVDGAMTMSPHGAGMKAGLVEVDHPVVAGATSQTVPLIPAAAMVLGVTARVTEEITGTLSAWTLGSVGAADRFGAGLGLAAGSWARGILSTPLTYWTPEPLVLTATGGAFAAGRVRIAVHYLELSLPRL